jgi:FMN reductase
MSREIVFVAGSPSPTSRSSYIAGAVEAHAKREGLSTRTFSVHDFDAAELLLARVEAPRITAFLDSVRGAAAIVLSTPVYKATYAGALKTIVDLIPPDALAARPALGIATTKLAAHGPEVDRAFRALFAFFKAETLDPVVVLDEELRIDSGQGTFTSAARERVEAAARAVVDAAARTR